MLERHAVKSIAQQLVLQHFGHLYVIGGSTAKSADRSCAEVLNHISELLKVKNVILILGRGAGISMDF